ncbi:MAG: hypothetical protein WCS42_09940, partial [Verrucomicrobiota bacterium]
MAITLDEDVGFVPDAPAANEFGFVPDARVVDPSPPKFKVEAAPAPRMVKIGKDEFVADMPEAVRPQPGSTSAWATLNQPPIPKDIQARIAGIIPGTTQQVLNPTDSSKTLLVNPTAPKPQPPAPGPRIALDPLPMTAEQKWRKDMNPDRMAEFIQTPLWYYVPKEIQDGLASSMTLKHPELADKTDQYISGAAKGVGDLAKGFTSPFGILTLGLGGAPRVMQKVIGLAFATQIVSENPEIGRQLGEQFALPPDQRDSVLIARLFTQLGGGSTMAAMLGGHAAFGKGDPAPVVPQGTAALGSFFDQSFHPEIRPRDPGVDVGNMKSANPQPATPDKQIGPEPYWSRTEEGEVAPHGETQASKPLTSETQPARTADGAVDQLQTAFNKMRADAAEQDNAPAVAKLDDLAAQIKDVQDSIAKNQVAPASEPTAQLPNQT